MTTSEPEKNENSAADLEKLAEIANTVMDLIPPAWKSVRNNYAGEVDQVVLQNLPAEVKNSDWAEPTKDQLHRLPETIASGESPKTPLANRDTGMNKVQAILQKGSFESIPFGFLEEIRVLFPDNLESLNSNMASSAAAFVPLIGPISDDLQMQNLIRALEPVSASDSMPLQYPQPYSGSHQVEKSFSDLASMSDTTARESGKLPSSADGFMPGYYLPSADHMKYADPYSYGANFGSGVLLKSGANSKSLVSAQQFDIDRVRRDFPILNEKVNGRDIIWLDNAATTQKPQQVIDRLSRFYSHENSNTHRAAHELAARSTDAYESARETVRRFINASAPQEIIFVRGATEAINLVAQSWGRKNIQKDDEIVITWLEHHANIVPWQMLCNEKGAKLRVAPVDDRGQVILEEYERLLGPRTKLVAFTQVSNALGTVTPLNEMVQAAKRHGATVLIDGAQAIAHMQVDVQAYGCDFYVFSGHKVFAPTGIGVVYGKADVLEKMPPWHGGGNMIQDVTFERTLYQRPPARFEAGTGSIADAVALATAIEYIERIGMLNIYRHENELMQYGNEALGSIPGLRIIGTAAEKAGVISFVLEGFKTEQVSAILNQYGIAVRSGHHCAQPILRRFGVESSVRPSLALYNKCEEIDYLVAAIWDMKQGRGLRPL